MWKPLKEFGHSKFGLFRGKLFFTALSQVINILYEVADLTAGASEMQKPMSQ